MVQRPSIRPCQGRDRRFESGRDRINELVSASNGPVADLDRAARFYSSAEDQVRHLNDDEVRDWWTQRFTALAAERRRLTRARMRAAIALPSSVRDLVFSTRALAAKREPALDADDNSVPTIPEAARFRPPGS